MFGRIILHANADTDIPGRCFDRIPEVGFVRNMIFVFK